MNLEELKSKHPEVYESAFNEGKSAGVEEGKQAGLTEGKTEGAKNERERIQAIETINVPGYENIVNENKFKPEATKDSVSALILQAAQEKRNKPENKGGQDNKPENKGGQDNKPENKGGQDNKPENKGGQDNKPENKGGDLLDDISKISNNVPDDGDQAEENDAIKNMIAGGNDKAGTADLAKTAK